MKYLENLPLENITKSITNCQLGGGLIINGRIELYSTKKAGDDKKQSKLLESKLSEANTSSSSAGDLSTKTKRVLGDLIQTLNASFNDYDFSELTPDSFSQLSASETVQTINSYLAELTINNPNAINDMWRDVNTAMGNNLANCEAYRLDDSAFIDEVDNGMVWSYNFFFCSKELKRVCYFTCAATSKYHNKLDMSGYTGGNMSDDDADVDAMDTDNDRNGSGESDEEADGSLGFWD